MKKLMANSYILLVFLLLYLPIFVLILYSFNDAKFSLLWHGFSSKWYQELLNDTSLWSSLMNSIYLALTASLIATSIALFACIQFFLYGKHISKSLVSSLLLLIIVPDIVLGIALLVFFNLSGFYLGFFSLLIAHITFCLPFSIISISTRIRGVDPNIYFCALDLGASRFLALRKIIFPILRPAILSAFLLSFTLSFDDVIVSYFVAGPDYSILPLYIFSLVKAGVTPELNALCTITFIFSMLLVCTSHFLTRKK